MAYGYRQNAPNRLEQNTLGAQKEVNKFKVRAKFLMKAK